MLNISGLTLLSTIYSLCPNFRPCSCVRGAGDRVASEGEISNWGSIGGLGSRAGEGVGYTDHYLHSSQDFDFAESGFSSRCATIIYPAAFPLIISLTLEEGNNAMAPSRAGMTKRLVVLVVTRNRRAGGDRRYDYSKSVHGQGNIEICV